MTLTQRIEHARLALAQAERIYRTRSILRNRAMRDLMGLSPVDTRHYTDAEYRLYSDRAIQAERIVSRIRAELEALETYAIVRGVAI